MISGPPILVTVMPLSGSLTTVTASALSGGSPAIGGVPTTFTGVMQALPTAVTFSSISATFVNGTSFAAPSSTVTLTAQLYKVPKGTITASGVVGFSCFLSPNLGSGTVAVSTVTSCVASGLTGVFAAGDAGFVVVYATVTAGIGVALTINGSVSVGIGQ
jgi:hypothetical protein